MPDDSHMPVVALQPSAIEHAEDDEQEQAAHAAEPAEEYSFAGHARQADAVLAPVDDEYVPDGHDTQTVPFDE